MTVFLAIAIVVAIALMGLISARLTSIEKHEIQNAGIASGLNALKKFTDECNKTANGNFVAIAERFGKEDERVEDIISQLEAITTDVKRLDETTAQDHRDLVDIRERYILWRKPINWAGDYEEQESEERS